MTRRVSQYLTLVREVESLEIARGLEALDERRRRLSLEAEARPEETARALGYLARKRLLASNTLRHSNPRERQAWDDANRWLSERVEQDPAPPQSIDELRTLNALLTGGGGAVRDVSIYSCEQEYLSPAEVPGELRALEEHLMTSGRLHPALVASTVYISIVTIHPFENGNGRTARLAADRVLLQSGYLPICFLSPVSSHVAQMQSGPTRDPAGCVGVVLSAVAESYSTVLRRIGEASG